MRLTLRKVTQVISGLSLVVFLNLALTVLVRKPPDSDALQANQLVAEADSESQRQGKQFGDAQPLFADDSDSFGSPRAGLYRKISELRRVERSVDELPSLLHKKIYPSNVVSSDDKTLLSAPKKTRTKLGASVDSFENENLTPTELKDVFISVKTTSKYHAERLDLLLQTWVVFAQDSTYFFTDADDPEYTKKTRNHLINTNCTSDHTRQALCCKMSVEYDYFIASKKRWFCHVDDDTYVNTAALVRLLLRRYNHTEDWYFGKPSLSHPLQIQDRDHPGQNLAFWFATGGAGFCISRGLALKMMPYTSGGRLRSVCEHIRLPDDCAIGYIISQKLNKDLTIIPEFHSHLEGLWKVTHKDLERQITVSYMCVTKGPNPFSRQKQNCNTVDIPSHYSQIDDPTRFHSIHCLLYPNMPNCPQKVR